MKWALEYCKKTLTLWFLVTIHEQASIRLVNGTFANPTTKHFLIYVMLNCRCKIIDKQSYMKLGVAEYLATFKFFNRFYLHLENKCFYFVLCAAQLSMWDCNSSVHKLLLFKMKNVKWWWWYQDEKCEIIMIMITMTITITTTTQQQNHCRAMEMSHHPGCYVMPGKVLLQAIFTLAHSGLRVL